MGMMLSPTVGLEEAQRGLFLALFDNLNDALTAQETLWDPRDQEFAARISRVYTPTELERVHKDNFYCGHRPSLIQAPIDRYPNCSVIAVDASEEPGADFDQPTSSQQRDALAVEVMVKASEEEGEEQVESRCLRTASAVLAVLADDVSLGGTFPALQQRPRVRLTDTFVRREEPDASGARWFWKGARLEYAFTKVSNW